MSHTSRHNAHMESQRIASHYRDLNETEQTQITNWKNNRQRQNTKRYGRAFIKASMEPRLPQPCESFGGTFGLDDDELRRQVLLLKNAGEKPDAIAERLGITARKVLELARNVHYARMPQHQ